MKLKHPFSVLGASALALMSMMAMSAGSAEALLWLIGGSNWSTSTFIDALESDGHLLYLGLDINCHTEADGELNSATTGVAIIFFSNCDVLEDHFCKVNDKDGVSDMLIAEVKFKLVLLDVVKFEPIGSNFTVIGFHRTLLPDDCLLILSGEHEELLKVEGSVCALVAGNELVSNIATSLLYAPTSTTHTEDCELQVGGNTAQLDAEVLALRTSDGAAISAH